MPSPVTMGAPQEAQVLEEIGRAIAQRRHAVGISQEALAVRAGFHRTYLSVLERGRRNVTLVALVRLAHALDCKASDLLQDAGH